MHITRWFGSPGRRGFALAGAVLTLGLGTGAAAATGLADAHRDAAAATLELRTATVRGALDTTFQHYADTVDAIVAAAATLPPAGLARTVTRLVAHPPAGAQQIVLIDAEQAVLVQRSLDGTTPAPRTHLDPEPALAAALTRSRDTGRPAAGPARVLPADRDLPPAHRQQAFDLVAPVHDGTFRGWVVVSVRAGDLLAESLRAAGVTGVTTALTSTGAEGTTREIARWPSGAPLDGTGATIDVALAGHTWQVLVHPVPETAGDAAATAAMLGAVTLSFLLAGTVLAAETRRHKVAGRVRRYSAAGQVRAQATELADGSARTDLTDFAAAAGEHLLSPLHAIAGYSELLREETGPHLDEASRGFLERIGGNTRRLLGTVDELVAYASAKDAALKPEPVDTTTLALGVVAARLDAIEGRRPCIDVADLPPVLADAELTGEVLGRLVDNAARFVRPGATATITIGAREHSPGWWRIEVADRGIGVPDDHRARIFAPFHRAPSAHGYPGPGLGLAVCRGIIGRHGGEIGCDPNPGGGSIFWFTVPATTAAPAAGPELLAADLT
ncbi:ATP-binding protein [Couchioplanes caeruleus]|uniref:sensor histidine kinase n=1 Tax=Couchioplanes caeruleus TaxID=56438 RepID=UPI0020BE3616|nr:ATP-binding protein [Couchioplanes caeruleus]UQU62905.1 ATP-binding protein [Couchioplanes caeruleus]